MASQVKTRDLSKREPCPHAENCYRKNPHHFKEYSHKHLLVLLKDGGDIPKNWPQSHSLYQDQLSILKSIEKINIEENASSSKEPPAKKLKTDGDTTRIKNTSANTMLEKLKANAPYNLFFTTIPKSSATLSQKNAITFSDILCPSLGKLKCSLQINFMIDVMWLLEQYKTKNLHTKPLTVLYGDDWPDMEEYMDRFCPNVKYHRVKLKDPFGVHHSKVGLYMYEDNSLRVVVSTANLYYEDWNHYNQGLWLSDKCPVLSDDSNNNGESPTGFKKSLSTYLKEYKLPILKEWIDYVQKADFSNIKVFLVTSTPGKKYPDDAGCHVHTVTKLLKKHCFIPPKTTSESESPSAWGVFAQSSSIGSMGKSPAEWLRSVILRTLAVHKNASVTTNPQASLNMVYPSVDNVMNGYFGPQSGGCLPYSKATHEKQKWLQEYMHQWIANNLSRSRAMPHIKSYCRVSPCLKKLAYFLLTSANLSKSAWGGNIQKDQSAYVRSYEAGVLFLPDQFNETFFEISQTLESQNENKFPFMYDLPLTPYKSSD